MTNASFMIGAFGDEIADDLETQLQVLNELKIPCLELRAAWGVNVLNLSDEQVAQVRALCAGHGVTVSALGSPIGKSPIEAPIETEVENLRRVIEIGRQLGTENIRIFSFHPPGDSDSVDYDSYVDSAIERIGRLVEVAEAEGRDAAAGERERDRRRYTRALREAGRCAGERAPGLPVGPGQLCAGGRGAPHGARLAAAERAASGYVHIKDCTLDGTVKAAGEGDGQVPELLTELVSSGYKGMLALEPHLAMAGHSSGFSGPDGMAYAVKALRAVMRDVGAEEVSGFEVFP